MWQYCQQQSSGLESIPLEVLLDMSGSDQLLLIEDERRHERSRDRRAFPKQQGPKHSAIQQM